MGDLFGIRMCAAYTTESRITFNLEYHFNQAGFARADWRNWFAAGHAGSGSTRGRRQEELAAQSHCVALCTNLVQLEHAVTERELVEIADEEKSNPH